MQSQVLRSSPYVLLETNDESDIERLRTDARAVLVRRPLDAEVLEAARFSVAAGPVWGFGAAGDDPLPTFLRAAHATLTDPRHLPFRERLAADATHLLDRWFALTGVAEARIAVMVIDHDNCTKLHADYLTLRILVTYHGPGTVIARTEADDPPLVSADPGDVVLLSGHHWSSRPGARHRSPRLQGTGLRRVVLRIDSPPGH